MHSSTVYYKKREFIDKGRNRIRERSFKIKKNGRAGDV